MWKILERPLVAHSGYAHILAACPKAVTHNNLILLFETHEVDGQQ
jgi:hypothetical protein